MAEKGTQVNSF